MEKYQYVQLRYHTVIQFLVSIAIGQLTLI